MPLVHFPRESTAVFQVPGHTCFVSTTAASAFAPSGRVYVVVPDIDPSPRVLTSWRTHDGFWSADDRDLRPAAGGDPQITEYLQRAIRARLSAEGDCLQVAPRSLSRMWDGRTVFCTRNLGTAARMTRPDGMLDLEDTYTLSRCVFFLTISARTRTSARPAVTLLE